MCLLNVAGSTSIKLSKSWTGGERCGLRENYLAQCPICEEEIVFVREEGNGLVKGSEGLGVMQFAKPCKCRCLVDSD
jgi:hypothetical protein